jgi:Fe(3+) dicitrate transport protein
MRAEYVKGTVISAGRNANISGNEVESVPRVIARGGLSAYGSGIHATLQVSHVSSTFADALNTVTPSANGAVGLVPAYTLIDCNASYALTSHVQLSAGANNLLDRQYFTKRPQFYPGPGVWPSDGRSLQVSLRLR